MFLPAFGTFPSVVSGFVMSHKNSTLALLSPRSNGATGMSDMAGYAARVAVERSGSCRDTMERMGRAT
jgi:hypothetical protein